ncbi:hypothetical protein, partial [Serratia silvae]|uniref:hypothetical protein n=1 Tax=Serratia silvae TaxID=2824122 RepID=UPI0039F08840
IQIGERTCRIYAQFFELGLKINISLFTKYEINVLVCYRILLKSTALMTGTVHPSASLHPTSQRSGQKPG